MGCEPLGGGSFACSRASRACSVPGCGRRATTACAYPLGGAKAGSVCDRPLCDGCAEKITREGARVDLCPPHASIAVGPQERAAKALRLIWGVPTRGGAR